MRKRSENRDEIIANDAMNFNFFFFSGSKENETEESKMNRINVSINDHLK